MDLNGPEQRSVSTQNIFRTDGVERLVAALFAAPSTTVFPPCAPHSLDLSGQESAFLLAPARFFANTVSPCGLPERSRGAKRVDHPGFAVIGNSTATPTPAATFGVLAQLVERLNGIEEVSGSIPLGSIPLIMKHLHERNRFGENKAENKSGKIR